ncbi:Phosphatidylinositol transfer protein 3 [Linum perenne]
MFLRRKQQNCPETDLVQRDAKVNGLRAALGSLSGRSSKYCTDACLRRYLEARNWNVDKATKMLQETLKWRAIYKPEETRWHEIAHEGETGKVYRANFRDRVGRTVLIMRPGMQAIKYFMDPKTSQKVKFVYPNKKESVEIMSSLFDADNLPKEFGGKATLHYDHEEFSRLMALDDVRTAKFWGLDEKPTLISSNLAGNQVAPEPMALAPPAS